ncbi:MAG: hypothetical protein R3F59_08560 [Myxococcota bacterium]
MKFYAITPLVALGALAAGCAQQGIDPDQIPDNVPTGTLTLSLGSPEPSDIDPRVEEVWVRVGDLSVRSEEHGWVDLTEGRQDVNLMAADPTVIASSELWTGSYDRTEIGIEDTWIVVDGQEQDLAFLGDVDPNDILGKGLVVGDSFYLDEDMETDVLVSWDLDQNLEPYGDGWGLGASTTLDVDIE